MSDGLQIREAQLFMLTLLLTSLAHIYFLGHILAARGRSCWWIHSVSTRAREEITLSFLMNNSGAGQVLKKMAWPLLVQTKQESASITTANYLMTLGHGSCPQCFACCQLSNFSLLWTANWPIKKRLSPFYRLGILSISMSTWSQMNQAQMGM